MTAPMTVGSQARAQSEPVVVGGSGLPPVEVNPGALDALGVPPGGSGPVLPGIALAPEAPIELIPPPGVEPIITHTAKPVLPVPTPAPKPQPIAEPEEPSFGLETEMPPTELGEAEAPAAPAAPSAATPEAPAGVEQPSLAPSEGTSIAEAPGVGSEEAPKEAAPAAPPAAAPAAATPEAAMPEAVTPEAQPEPAREEAQPAPESTVAALTPAEQPAAVEPLASGQIMRIAFGTEQADLPTDAGTKLSALAQQLKTDEEARLQLKAYASGTAETASQARRLSLSRALSVRSFLIDQGIRSTRIDVRALGIPEDDGPADRVDVILVRR